MGIAPIADSDRGYFTADPVSEHGHKVAAAMLAGDRDRARALLTEAQRRGWSVSGVASAAQTRIAKIQAGVAR